MTLYKISQDQREYIESRFFQWSFGDNGMPPPSESDFQKLSHPAELHFLAHIYNWDDDTFVLRWILESSLCSRATANLLFWRSLPSYFEGADFNLPETCPAYGESGFELIPLVLQRYERNNFSVIDIAFDPTPEMEEVRIKNPNWEVPLGVFDVIQGIEISA